LQTLDCETADLYYKLKHNIIEHKPKKKEVMKNDRYLQICYQYDQQEIPFTEFYDKIVDFMEHPYGESAIV
jgi:hypothetical protein